MPVKLELNSYLRPMNDIEIKKKISSFIRNEVLLNPDYPLDDDEPLISAGLVDSHSLVHIAVFIEQQLGVVIPDTEFTVENMDTVARIAQRVGQGG